MSEEEIFKMLLVESIDKYPLLNELFAIRDSRGKRNDYTIFVNGYISLDVINKAIEKVNLLNNLKEIEKSHQEENGKLRVEFEKVYQDNLTLVHELEQYKLLEANIDKANKIIAENKFDEGLYGLLMQEKEKNKELEKQINLNKKTVEIAQTQILEYSQGYKDGLNKETTATAIVARELELNFIRQEIKHRYISKEKIIEKLQELENKSGGNTYHVQAMINAEKNILKELLEEK